MSPRCKAVGGVDELARRQHFERRFAPHVTRQRNRGRGAKKADVDAGNGKTRIVCRDGEVAHRHQLATCRGGDSVHPRNDRLRQRLDAHHHAAAIAEQAPVILQVWMGPHLLKIVARAKGFAGTPQNEHAHGGIAAERIQRSFQCRQHFLG